MDDDRICEVAEWIISPCEVLSSLNNSNSPDSLNIPEILILLVYNTKSHISDTHIHRLVRNRPTIFFTVQVFLGRRSTSCPNGSETSLSSVARPVYNICADMSSFRNLTLDHLRSIGMISYSCSHAASPPPPSIAELPTTLRVLTFNILFPNSERSGVWWIYKYYRAQQVDLGTPVDGGQEGFFPASSSSSSARHDVSHWEYRKALLRQLVAAIDADVVCFQEPWNCRAEEEPFGAGGDLFSNELAFMRDLGYDGAEILDRGSIRPATFWRTGTGGVRLRKLSSAHKYRALTVLFEVSVVGGAADGQQRGGNRVNSGVRNESGSRLQYVVLVIYFSRRPHYHSSTAHTSVCNTCCYKT